MRLWTIIEIFLLLAITLPQPNVLAYVPEPQTVRILPGGGSPAINGFHIYVADDEYLDVATVFQNWVKDQQSTSGLVLPIHDLSELETHGNKQIILGNPAIHTSLQAILSGHKMSQLDLGIEGYLLHSEPAPGDPSTWRIIIIANGLAGIRNGLATLLQDIQSNNASIPRMVIRDYPDRPFRAYRYRLTPGPGNSAWLTERKTEIDKLAKLGINVVFFNTGMWYWSLNELQSVVGGEFGISALFNYCRTLGMEPAVQLSRITPAPQVLCDPLWREGKFIAGERFEAHQGQDLSPTLPNFDNAAENFTWQAPGGGQFPDQWDGGTPGNPGPWGFDGSQIFLSSFNPTGDPNVSTALTTDFAVQQPETESGDPPSYYVLTVKLKEVSYTQTGPEPPLIEIRTDRNAGSRFWYTYIEPGNDERTYECPFAAPDGDPSLTFRISTAAAQAVSMKVVSVHLDRRNSGFVNLMVDPLGASETYPLKVTITDLAGNKYPEGNYTIHDVHSLTWDMLTPTPEVGSSITWNTIDPPGNKVRVYYTLGVPTIRGRGNTLTYCFNDKTCVDRHRAAINQLFALGLNPAYIGYDLDEVRGMNRCGRCVRVGPLLAPLNPGRGLPNNQYIPEFLNELLAEIAAENDPGNPTKLIVLGDMFNFMEHSILPGGEEDYEKIVWLGQSGAPSGGLGYLTGNLILALWGLESAANVRAVEPQFPGQPNVSVVAMLSNDDPIPWAENPTWYDSDGLGSDALGFSNYRVDYTLDIPTANETQLYNFAWKRYANPDATLQVFGSSGDYKTDDVADHVVQVVKNHSLTFYPFGRAETRDGCTASSNGTIYWGNGTQTPLTPANWNGIPVSHAFSQVGDFVVTLQVSTGGAACAGSKSAAVRIHVVPACGHCPDPEEHPSLVKPLTTAIRGIAPNPFAGSAVIQFTTDEPSIPEIKIYDVTGRLVRSEALPSYPAGAWEWVWDGRASDGSQTRSGIYFVHLQAGTKQAMGRLVRISG
jgi:flagellar hook capping protein FlgD